MPTAAALNKDDPRMIAWEAWKQTEEYANALRWAETISVRFSVTEPIPAVQSHANGSLWAAFIAGWTSASPPIST
jgi:hypothetical protein